ncbi:MAG: HAD-IA family hydrolase [Alphaproteobacteria bacterium]|nr:HAD-IA family hydrolase [Alphaproteobacteria bacterium]
MASPALIFDLDGTLVDTAPDLLGATNAVMAAEGLPLIPPQTLRHMVGFGARSLIEQAMDAVGRVATAEELPRLVDIFMAHYRTHIADASIPFPGVRETLSTLKQDGARLAVLTNKPHDLVAPLLTRLGLLDFFADIYGAGRMSYVKPDARIFHDVVRDIGGHDGGAVMIGDSITDLKTAQAAGAPCILFSYGYTPIPARELGADIVLDEFAQLPGALRSLKLL